MVAWVWWPWTPRSSLVTSLVLHLSMPCSWASFSRTAEQQCSGTRGYNTSLTDSAPAGQLGGLDLEVELEEVEIQVLEVVEEVEIQVMGLRVEVVEIQVLGLRVEEVEI